MFNAVSNHDQVSRTRDFLHLVQPSEGWLIALAKRGDKRHQQIFGATEELIAWQEEHDRNGWDVYHACASFRDPQGVWNPHRGKFELRCHANVFRVRSLWMEIDTRLSKPDAFYADHREAIAAVSRFCEQARLPVPVRIRSGGGPHCYWPFDRDLTVEEWKPLADGLKGACIKFGLHADPNRTSDQSSILRTPGTHHWSSGEIVRNWCDDD